MAELKEIRVTGPTLKVLATLLEHHPESISGADIMNEKKILSGTLYPLLDRLSASGWLTSEWEDIDPSIAGRPRKRLYRFTGEGVHRASQVIQDYGISWKQTKRKGKKKLAREIE